VDLRDLVHAVLAYEALAAREWVAEAASSGLRWSEIPVPAGLDATELAVAAGLAEMLAQRAGVAVPAWVHSIERAPREVFLVRAADTMPRLRRMCREEGPEPLRSRGIFAPPDYLTAA